MKLNEKGVGHIILLVIVVLVTAVVGAYMLVASNANSLKASKDGRIPPPPPTYKTNSPEVDRELTRREQQLPADLKPRQEDIPPASESSRSKDASVSSSKKYARSKVESIGKKFASRYWHKVSPRTDVCSESRRGTNVVFMHHRFGANIEEKGENVLAYVYPKGRSPAKSKKWDCVMHVDEKDFGRMLSPRRATYLCNVIVHEYGHLHGYGHSSDSRSIMYWSLSAQESKIRACSRHF